MIRNKQKIWNKYIPYFSIFYLNFSLTFGQVNLLTMAFCSLNHKVNIFIGIAHNNVLLQKTFLPNFKNLIRKGLSNTINSGKIQNNRFKSVQPNQYPLSL